MQELQVDSPKIQHDLVQWFKSHPRSRPVIYIEPDYQSESIGVASTLGTGPLSLERFSCNPVPDATVREADQELERALVVKLAALLGRAPHRLSAYGAFLVNASREEVSKIAAFVEVRSVDLSGNQKELA